MDYNRDIKIADYRGFEVFFDKDEDMFYLSSSRFDTETTKKSYSAVKTYIDNFIKDNLNFKPFWIY